ncbi:putative T7SS-secreted protein [Pseudonocardia lacus]|uniref:putative T7SS-secreted protein n=1 Tax=Pseudonocardia lacus TaxID=2835865 RepID=UPI001BDC86BE|nr:hypothetical protein [Pseudonocardia lacus]
MHNHLDSALGPTASYESADVLSVDPDALRVLARMMTNVRRPQAALPPGDVSGDRVLDQRISLFTAHYRAVVVDLDADHRAAIEHLRRTADAYTHADHAAATLLTSGLPRPPSAVPRFAPDPDLPSLAGPSRAPTEPPEPSTPRLSHPAASGHRALDAPMSGATALAASDRSTDIPGHPGAQNLIAGNPDGLHALAAALTRDSYDHDDAISDLLALARNNGWAGDAATAFRRHLEDRIARHAAAREATAATASKLTNLADALTTAQHQARHANHLYARADVIDPPPTTGAPAPESADAPTAAQRLTAARLRHDADTTWRDALTHARSAVNHAAVAVKQALQQLPNRGRMLADPPPAVS